MREDGLSHDNLVQAVEIGCHQLCPPAASLCLEHVRVAHTVLPEVQAYQVRDVDDVWRVVDTRCDGLTVDDPGWLVHEGRSS